ncbi:hypothetical protein N8I77_002112 [Diaporthe amygdali]|uniref:CFEM domain-containing protein n=1 Tax=Phomopsis amygdali TaxID=1214568 RepID=A0AAD9SU42_PHOAM|nr:hypothetical protein N8I77_002112 [Diaporthe amygdali]KAK2615350.1 hypothetical protein N8I77_002112 [Diaporthe amygdali]
MQFKAIVLSGVLGLVAAQSSDVASLVAELPSCSLTCLLAGASAADCESMDYSCQCNKQDVIVANATSCLTSSCNTNDIATTQTVSQQICEAVTGGNSTSTSSTGSNATTTGSSTSSSASASSTGAAGSSAGSRPELYGLGLAAIAGVAGLMMVM